MLQSYFRLALRNLWRNKLYSALNIGGLALGMAISMLMLLYVVHEYNYDRFHSKAQQIVRMTIQQERDGMQLNSVAVSFTVSDRIKRQVPQVEQMTRLIPSDWQGKDIVRHQNQQFFVKDIHYADSSFFDFFAFPMKQGNGRIALSQPNSVILTASLARKFFGQADPMGKTVVFNNAHRLTVAGVMEDLPSNTAFTFPMLISTSSFKQLAPAWRWETAPEGETYFRLSPQITSKQFASFLNKYVKLSNEPKVNVTAIIDPLTGMHIGGFVTNSMVGSYVQTFLWIGISVLLLALINYMNLTTARATVRAKEVSMRKVLGGNQRALIGQFFVESAFVSALSFCLGVGLMLLLKDPFLSLIDAKIDQSFLVSSFSLLTLSGILLMSILVSGSYPAFVLSRFAPINTLKGQINLPGNLSVRQVLVVFQFVVSITLIFCTVVAQQQLRYMQTKDLGLNVDQVMGISLSKSVGNHYSSFRQDILAQSGVDRIATSAMAFYGGGFNVWSVKTAKRQKPVTLAGLSVDSSFVPTLRLRWKNPPQDAVAGQLFINETAAKELGIAKNPLGQVLTINDRQQEVRGVVEDFHMSSVKDPIQPTLLMVGPDTSRGFADYNGTLYIRFRKGVDLQQQVKKLEQIVQKHASDSPFDYYFLDDAFNRLFQTEQRLANVLNVFTVAGILIACLGLFGLVAFSAERRTKEIGIRKVLGASVSSLVSLLSKDFLKLVALAILIASPLAWYTMDNWLQAYTYKITIDWRVFALVSLLAMGIAFLTISYQSIKAALVNPVKSLRSE
ncbi:ABC transporter permease [Spirosoma sp. KUDC1026]|uniref:ABC transporter permease n=1 Tax=Spirosoma sp. KUDC1026 TaxID=2745947 RepID=UPI00159BDE6C|nr:ABC transporter permease [Spirosoma sp. KUDC1026]QKZ12831.1 ABC transporter permease [Spirosoma sp. KUDC1026]